MKKKTLTINAILNGIKTAMSVIFPLISFPYVSRILQVENIGKYNFSTSIISYFQLIAGLGIVTYSVREGARYIGNSKKMSEFSSEIFSINLISTCISYLFLFLCIFIIPKFQEYEVLILILSIQLFFTTIGVEWLYQIYENFLYITVRSILLQAISLVLMFLLVKNKSDLYIYACITVFANVGANIINWIQAKKYCKIRVIFSKNLIIHIRPVLVFFAMEVAKIIYISSDTTILGFMASDYNVGLYSVATKIYTIVKSMLASILIVAIPRLSNYLANNKKEEYTDTLNSIVNSLVAIVVPAVVGLGLMSSNIIGMLSGEQYMEGTKALQILSLALFVSVFGWFYNSCVLVPNKKEKKVLIAMIASALLNVILNLIMIPFGKQNAAAFTTFLAELCSLLICVYYSKDIVKIKLDRRNIVSTTFGTFVIVVICKTVYIENFGQIENTIVIIILATIAYACVLLIMKNPIINYGKRLRRRG